MLRNYPVIGHLRYFFEQLGEYFRQYFFAGDRDEMPFNRSTRGWVYRLAKDEGGIIGFGSTYDLHEPGAIIFVNHPFPVLEEDRLPTPSLVIGEGYCEAAVRGALDRQHQRHELRRDLGAGGALAVARRGGGRLLDGHRRGRARRRTISKAAATSSCRSAPPSTACATRDGNLSPGAARTSSRKEVKAFEIKLSQGAKPGKGGVLPAARSPPRSRAIRGIPAGADSISPNRHRDIANMNELLDKVAYIRELTGRPVGVKTAIGGWRFMNELCEAVQPPRAGVRAGFPRHRRRRGRLAAPRRRRSLDHMSLSIDGGAAARGGLR